MRRNVSRHACLISALAGAVLIGDSPSAVVAMAAQAGVVQQVVEPGASTTSFVVTSRDGERRYDVQIVRPTQPAPAGGYPVLYMLDGRSTLPVITPEIRERAWSKTPTVFVAIAHDAVDQAAANRARTLDYTVGPRGAVVRPSDPPSGGADAFLDLLVEEIEPRVARAVAIDPARQAFYGHSYGALCVLHALFTRPHLFQTYIAASPSLWWGDGYLERAVVEAAPALRQARARVLLTIGDQEARRPGGGRGADPDAGRLNVVELESIARQLEQHPSIDVTSRVFAGRNHGAALPPSVIEGLALITGTF